MNTLSVVTDDAISDEELFNEVVHNRSSRALETLYQRHRALLTGVIMRVLREESMVDDVLQDVFIQVWTQGDHYSSDKGLVLGWLITMARRRALDRLRQRYAYQKATDRFETEHESQSYDSEENCMVDQDVCRNDLRCLMLSMINALPPAQQQVIRMAYFEDCSQRQIAGRLGLPLGTVKTRMELGMRKLNTAITPIRQMVA